MQVVGEFNLPNEVPATVHTPNASEMNEESGNVAEIEEVSFSSVPAIENEGQITQPVKFDCFVEESFCISAHNAAVS